MKDIFMYLVLHISMTQKSKLMESSPLKWTYFYVKDSSGGGGHMTGRAHFLQQWNGVRHSAIKKSDGRHVSTVVITVLNVINTSQSRHTLI